MLRISCPWCGVREHIEFTYGGDGSVTRPDAGAPQPAWVDYVYVRDNPRGAHVELWHHTAGCRRWLKVARNTQTHAIAGTSPPESTP